MATCSASELQAQACANYFIASAQDEVLFYALLLQLLCNISAGGGTGGSAQVYVYTGSSPSTPPDNTASPALAYKEGGGPMYTWNITSQNWE